MSENLSQNEPENKDSELQYQHETKDQKGCLKYLLILMAIFLGAFLAVYFVADITVHKYFYPPKPAFLEMRDIDDMIKEEDMTMKDLLNYQNTPSPFVSAPVKIQTLQEDNFYKIILDLKPFNGNVNNITIKAKPYSIGIVGKYDSKTKNSKKDISFVQNFSLPEKIDVKAIKKQKEGNNYIITLPIED